MKIVDKYSAKIENVLIIGDFNVEVHENDLAKLILDYNVYSPMKCPTCFKSANGRCSRFVLTN